MTKKPSSKYRGLWLPDKILTCKELSYNEQKILCMIHALSTNLKDGKKYCYALNPYFAELLNIKTHTVSNKIASLKRKGLVFDNYGGKNDAKRLLCINPKIEYLWDKNWKTNEKELIKKTGKRYPSIKEIIEDVTNVTQNMSPARHKDVTNKTQGCHQQNTRMSSTRPYIVEKNGVSPFKIRVLSGVDPTAIVYNSTDIRNNIEKKEKASPKNLQKFKIPKKIRIDNKVDELKLLVDMLIILPIEFIQSKLFLEAMLEFIVWRRTDLKQPYTKRSAELQVNQFVRDKNSPEVVVIAIERSIINNWRGIFPGAVKHPNGNEDVDYKIDIDEFFSNVKLGDNIFYKRLIRCFQKAWGFVERDTVDPDKDKYMLASNMKKMIEDVSKLMGKHNGSSIPLLDHYVDWLDDDDQNWIQRKTPKLFSTNSTIFKQFVKWRTESLGGVNPITGKRY